MCDIARLGIPVDDREGERLELLAVELAVEALPGTDLREGTPTMPLLFAAREDDVVRRALAGGSLEGALLRVAATGAIERSREAALEYAARARSFLGAHPHRDELEALTYAVVDRAG